MESLQMLQKKHSLCQASVSKATNFVLPNPPLPRKESTGLYFDHGFWINWIHYDVIHIGVLKTKT